MYNAVPGFRNFETVKCLHACTTELRKLVLVLDLGLVPRLTVLLWEISSEKSLPQPVSRSVTLREWMEEQSQDAEVMEIIQFLETGELPSEKKWCPQDYYPTVSVHPWYVLLQVGASSPCCCTQPPTRADFGGESP